MTVRCTASRSLRAEAEAGASTKEEVKNDVYFLIRGFTP